jgi:hypothetical protein
MRRTKMSVNYESYNEIREDDLIRKYGRYGGDEGFADCSDAEITAIKRCDGCASKIYTGDTIYIVDKLCYCAECVEETEYIDDCFG